MPSQIKTAEQIEYDGLLAEERRLHAICKANEQPPITLSAGALLDANARFNAAIKKRAYFAISHPNVNVR
jgi:hypothetical protein